MSKQIHFAGVSRVNGVLTFRTAGSPARAQQLAKLGDTDIKMTLLRGETFTKSEAAKKLLAQDFSNDTEILALLTSVANDDNPFKAPKKASKPRTVKVKKPRLILSPTVSVGADDAPYTPKQAAKIRAEFMKKLKAAYEAN
jgi:hypothetical protein